MQIFKTGMIGYGYWGRILSRYFIHHPGFRLVQIATRRPENVTCEHQEIAIVTPAEILENPEIDAVIVATPIGTHFPWVRQALERGKHVFCEKPLTLTAIDTHAAAQLAREKKRILFTDYILTFSPGIRQTIRLAHQGAAGKVQGYNFNLCQLGHFANSVYWDLGSHVLSILDQLVPLDYLEFRSHNILVRDGIVETGEIRFFPRSEKAEGGRGTIFLSFNHPFKERNISIYGETGTLVFDMMKPQPLTLVNYGVRRASSRDPLDKHIVNYEFDEMNTLREVIQAFHDTLSGTIPANLDMAVRVTEVLEKITGKPIVPK